MEHSLTCDRGRQHAGGFLGVDVLGDIAVEGLDDLALSPALVSHQLLVQIVP